MLSSANELINQGVDASEIMDQLDCELKDAAVSSSGAELRHIKQGQRVIGWIDYRERADRGGAISGLCTGIDELDERINGIG